MFRGSCGIDKGLELHLEAELGELGDEMFGLDVLRAAIEMDGTEILEVPSLSMW